MATTTKPKALIIGLDAATWDLIGPWAAKGYLPNLSKLIDRGVSGKLRSVIPPITPAAWTTFMTGKNPGKHGIYNFLEPSSGSYEMRYSNAGSRQSRTVFRILSDAGFTVGSMNIPFTFPPEKLNGFQISGMDTPAVDSAFIEPPDLRAELERVAGKLKLDIHYLGFMTTDEKRAAVLAEMEEIDKQWTNAAMYLLDHRPADVMMFVFMSIDTVQHHFWQYMDRDHFLHDPEGARQFQDAILRVYQRHDAAVGRLVEQLPSETSVFLVSDHGGGPEADRVVYLNRYLEQEGFLKYLPDKRSLFNKLQESMIRMVFPLLRNSLTPARKKWLASRFPALRTRFEGTFTAYANIDWSATMAYCSEILASPPSISINLKGTKPAGIVEPAEYEELLETLIRKLGELKDPRTGQPVIPRIYRRDEVFHGPCAKDAPDLILDWWSHNAFATSPSLPQESSRPVIEIRKRGASNKVEWGGTHRLDGILIGGGGPLKEGAEIEGAGLADFAPTLLYLMGVKVPGDMDGRVLTEMFKPEYIREHPVQYESDSQDHEEERQESAYSAEEAGQVEERLKALGYID